MHYISDEEIKYLLDVVGAGRLRDRTRLKGVMLVDLCTCVFLNRLVAEE